MTLRPWARTLRLEARASAYEDTVFAAILSDELRTSRLLSGRDIGVNLFSIALLAPGDVEAWGFQHDCHRHAEPVEFMIAERGTNASTSLAKVDVNVRQYALSVEPGRPCLDGYPAVGKRESERLLGPMDSLSPGGEVKAWLEYTESLILDAHQAMADLQQLRDGTVGILGTNDSLPQTIDRQMARQKDDLTSLEKQGRTLEDAARQLKTLWAQSGNWPAGVPGHRMAAARLALIGFLMGETPLLSCAGGRDFITPLEEEVRFLATFADSQGGHLPPLNLPADLSREARKAFALP